jgi:hypothetical protein
MSRYRVEAEFASTAAPSAEALARLAQLAGIHAGDAFMRPVGWRVTVFVAMMPSAGDAAAAAGEMMRTANVQAGMPEARMTDIHVHQVGAPPLPPELPVDGWAEVAE